MELEARPVGAKDRIEALDIVRGFALLGVLVANMLAFKGTVFYFTPPLSSITNSADSIAAWFIKLFVEGKFYTIFSFLFGLGFYIFMERAQDRGDTSRLFKRRIFVLLIVGLTHLIFLWTGDVLHTYAIAGFILLRKWKYELPRLKKSIFRYFILATVLLGGIYLLNGIYLAGVDHQTYLLQMKYRSMDIVNIFQQGTYTEILGTRITYEVFNALLNNLFVIPNVMVLFLLGLYAGKTQLHKNLSQQMGLIKRIWRLTLILGLLLNSALFIFMRLGESTTIAWVMALKEIIKYYSGIAICFFYITSIVLIINRPLGYRLMKPFAYVGRMALTNYLLQTVVAIFIFNGYGLGYFGRAGYAMGLLIAVAIYIAQLIFSKLWLSSFTYGPMEWLWRRFTYGRQINDKGILDRT